MAELDLSLSDALTDSVAQPGPESLVERDFVAQLEAEAFDDQVGETVGKTDYVPLLDDDDARPDTGAALENGAQEAHGVQKPGLKPTAGGQTTSSHPEAQGEAWPRSADQQQASAADFLSASMAGYSDPLGSQTGPAQMTDADLMGPFSGFSQSAGLGVNMEVGAAPLSAERMPSIAEPQHPTPLVGSEAPKEHVPMRPEPQAPRSPLDLATGASGDCWPDQAGRLPTELPFTPAVSAAIGRHAGDLAVSPDDPPDGWPGRESAGCAGGDERDGEGSDRKQKKKKKRRQKEEGSHEQLESKGHLELQEQGDTSPSTEEFYHRIGPRRDRGDGGWEEQLGKSGGRGKRGKSRKKIPDEWGVMAFVPASSQEAKAGLGSSNRAEVDASYSPWRQEVYPEEGLVPVPLSQDLFSITAPSIHPLVLNSELNATAAPFTMPSAVDGATLGARPAAALPGDSPPMDAENASSGGEAFSQPFSPGDEAPGGDTIDSGMFDGSGSLQEDRDVPDGDTSAFSPAARSSPGRSPKSEVLASAPPLSPSDASWLLNESQMSGSSEMFDFTDPSGRPLPLGLSFDAPSPAPLRSPKTTAQEFHPSPSAVKTSKAPVIGTSSPPSATPLAVPGSGLNPSAKPFFPSFADSMEEAAAVPPIAEVKSDMMEKAEKKEEKLEGSSVKKVDLFDPPDEAEQKSVKVELEKEMEGEKRNETGKGEEKEKKVDKVSEKEAEKVQESKIEKVIEDEEKDKVEEKQTVKVEEKKETEKVKEDKVEEKQTVKVEEQKETEKVKEDKVEEKQMVKVEEKKETEKVKEDKETEKVKEDKVEEKQTVKVEEKKETEKVKVTEVEKVREDKETEKVQEKEAEKVKEHKETEKVKVTEAEKVKEDKEKDKVQEKQTVEEKEKEMEKVEPVQQKAEQEDKMKVEESPDESVKTEKVDKVKVTEESKVDKTENLEKSTVEENTETKNLAKLETAEVKDDKKLLMDDVEMIPEKQPTPSKLDSSCDTLENKADTKTATEAGETKTATEGEVAPVEEKKAVEKKDEKKAPKGDGGDKAKKAKPVSNGTGAAPSKELGSADRKTKPAAGALKPTAAAKARPSSAAASLAPAKRPTPSNATSVTDKKTAASKAPPTAAAGPKRLSATSAGRPASSSLAGARDLKPKTPAEKRPLVPKAGTAASNQTASSAATKNGTAAASKTATRAAPSARTSTTTAAKKPLASRTDGKPGDEKRPSALRTSAANATKPKTATAAAARSSAPPAAASRPRTTAAKPATPSSAAAPEKKPSVSRAVRTASSTAATSKTAARPGAAAAPDVRNARSKIGSTDNMKHQPGGGKVSSASQSRALTSKDMSQGKVQILNKKVDLSKVTSKCGSKDNIKHKPGGGDVKIESHKVSFREKAQSKVGSMDNVSHSPGGGNVKAEGAQETTEGNGTPPSGAAAAAPASGPEPGRAGSPSARANGLKEGPPCDSEGLPEPRALDSRIPETN